MGPQGTVEDIADVCAEIIESPRARGARADHRFMRFV